MEQQFEFDINDQSYSQDKLILVPEENDRILGDHIIAHPAAHFEQVIPNELIEIIINEVNKLNANNFNGAEIGNNDQSGEFLSIRNSNVTWWYETHWACSIFTHYINLANRALWEYDLSHIDGIQIANYEKNGHYNWHSDYGTSHRKEYTRKLSASLLLSDPSEYEGGKLQILDYHNNILEPPQTKGTMIIFDSRIPHKVTPVTSGKRTSLVAWMLGPKLK